MNRPAAVAVRLPAAVRPPMGSRGLEVIPALGTDPRVLEFLPTEPWSDERIQRFTNNGIEVAKARGWILWPVIHREDVELIGFCGFSDEFPPNVEIGWRFRPEYWGRGLAIQI